MVYFNGIRIWDYVYVCLSSQGSAICVGSSSFAFKEIHTKMVRFSEPPKFKHAVKNYLLCILS